MSERELLLVVDDNPDNREVLGRRLERKGYQVLLAEDGKKALELVDNHPVDLILLDIMMPEVSGLDVLRTVRYNKPAHELPIIMVSAVGESDMVVEALNMGANDYVTKPVDFPVTLARIQSQLARRRDQQLAPLAPDPTFEVTVGGMLGPYKIDEKLGEGGFGSVYRGFDPRLQRPVAIKVIAREIVTDDEALKRFMLEARAVAKLQHPNVTSIYDLGTTPTAYIVMELVRGETLEDVAKPMDPAEVGRIGVQVCDALAVVHEAGIVHRDLKPANLMLDEAGTIHLMDFGLAKLADSAVKLTQSGYAMGTPTHMAPEQIDETVGKSDGRTDLYAMGVILYELLTGELPFVGGMHALLTGILTKKPVPPRSINPNVPESLEAICLKALAKKPDERYQTAQELGDCLRNWQT
ncbi:response regulator [bacterium CPR1]|nr:response regulator [bacterium CPR1]